MPSIWIDKLLKPLYDYEVTHLHYFQSTFQDNEEFLINASIWGDPSKAFYIIFPILLAFHQSTAVNYLGSVIACEWINQVLKWILHGHRPYWYVKQNDLLQLNQFGLKQTPITCETGPGLPSGHVMVNVVTGLTIVNFLISCARDCLSNPVTLVLRRVLWNGFFCFYCYCHGLQNLHFSTFSSSMCGRAYFWIFEFSIFRQKNRKIEENLPGCFLPAFGPDGLFQG